MFRQWDFPVSKNVACHTPWAEVDSQFAGCGWVAPRSVGRVCSWHMADTAAQIRLAGLPTGITWNGTATARGRRSSRVDSRRVALVGDLFDLGQHLFHIERLSIGY